jgi:hypothetical protein
MENIFHSFGSIDPKIEKSLAPWYNEYLAGAGMELYFVPLNKLFLVAMRYRYSSLSFLIFIIITIIIIIMIIVLEE